MSHLMCCLFFYERSYLDQLAEEINDKLQETGQVTISELCKAYDLPGDFLIQVMKATNLADAELVVTTFFLYLCSIHGLKSLFRTKLIPRLNLSFPCASANHTSVFCKVFCHQIPMYVMACLEELCSSIHRHYPGVWAELFMDNQTRKTVG